MLKNDWLRGAGVVLAATLVTFALRAMGVSRECLLMVYIVGVLCCAAITHGYRYSVAAALVSMMLFNYIYTQPLRTFAIGSRSDAMLLAFFLITAFISAGMTSRFLQALRKSQENEQRAEQLLKEKEGARLEAEQAQLKSSLLRSIGHDLRTPLTGIQCGSSYIAEHSDTMSPSDVSKMAADIGDQVSWLITLVENILYMTRIDNEKLEVNRQPEVVDDVMHEAVAHVPALRERPFRLFLPEQVETVPMDGKMIVQVLVNLLDNAVKHTPVGCPISLSARRLGDRIQFRVEDGGPGVPEGQRTQIFGSFVTSGKVGADGRKGMGLGLAICHAVVQAHGGTIDVGTSSLGGAQFTFTLSTEGLPNELPTDGPDCRG